MKAAELDEALEAWKKTEESDCKTKNAVLEEPPAKLDPEYEIEVTGELGVKLETVGFPVDEVARLQLEQPIFAKVPKVVVTEPEEVDLQMI